MNVSLDGERWKSKERKVALEDSRIKESEF